MPYEIRKTNGSLLTIVNDNSINNMASSLTFIGRGIVDYAQNIAENRFHVLENFANTTEPAFPVTGQLWWDTSVNILKIYNSSSFVPDLIPIHVKNFVEPSDNVVINSKRQLIVSGEYVIEAGGSLTIEPNAALVIL